MSISCHADERESHCRPLNLPCLRSSPNFITAEPRTVKALNLTNSNTGHDHHWGWPYLLRDGPFVSEGSISEKLPQCQLPAWPLFRSLSCAGMICKKLNWFHSETKHDLAITMKFAWGSGCLCTKSRCCGYDTELHSNTASDIVIQVSYQPAPAVQPPLNCRNWAI